MYLNKKAFTLVELIVVITILAILGTIAFISLQGYSETARDSVRISDMKNIETGLELELTKRGKITIPDDKIDIYASGTLIGHQGYVGERVMENLGVHGGGKDPLDENFYTYSTNNELTKYQILGYFEGSDNISLIKESHASNLTERYTILKGTELGIFVDPITNEPSQDDNLDIDIVTTNNEYKVIINNYDEEINGSGATIKTKLNHRIDKDGSCLAILRNGNSIGNGIYTIYPNNSAGFNVYCDMVTDGGGWTLALTVEGNSKAFGNNNKDANEWYKIDVIGNLPTTTEEIYQDIDFKSEAYSKINHNDTRLCLDSSNKCYTFHHNKWVSLFDFFDSGIEYTEASYVVNEESFINKRTYREDRIGNFEDALGITVNKLKCGWLGINKNFSRISESNNGSIGIITDADANCTVDAANFSPLDNAGFGIGINTCADGSTKNASGSECTLGGYNAVAGNALSANVDGVYPRVIGSWAVWVK